ncbi:hypothetical protein C0995_009167 [Termitomyces sp. Mi166|nr:hypothetical protein C0995_009167 [Termitomyces sp. Mi166\
MSSQYPVIEQDESAPTGQDGLPTYDDLAAQHGPNSRRVFGLTRVKKVLIEQCFKVREVEELDRKTEARSGSSSQIGVIESTVASPPLQVSDLQIETENLHIASPSAESSKPSPPLPILPFPSEKLLPTHLRVNQFGSRFLPHTTSPIRCLLPLESDRFLLIGHDKGLSVLDTFPEEWSEDGSLSVKGPDEAQARLIWTGESVIDMSLLEVENTGEGTQQGVVLALVGPEPDAKEADTIRTLRDSPAGLTSTLALASATIAYKTISSTSSPRRHGRLSPNRRDTSESSWDIIEDLPLRWATDFVPLAGSRLLNLSVLSYALWKDETRKGRGHLLAIATKNNILLYETPKGERAFRFVKEFYTPLQPRSLTFFKQSVQDVNRSISDVTPSKLFTSHRRTESTNTVRGNDSSRASIPSIILDYGTHLSLFVIFDKKASWIRITDSAVGEIELYDVGGQHRGEASTSSFRKSRISFDVAHPLPKWILPVQCTLPLQHRPGMTREVVLITRGTTTHIVPSPLPIGTSSSPPLSIVTWRFPLATISARISMESGSSPPFLQLIGLGGENGIQVQEISLSFLGSGETRAMHGDEPRRADEDLGGDSGFLCTGGHWDQSHHLFHRQRLSRSYTAMSTVSANSFASMESQDLLEKMKKERGVYAWCRKGLEDWRVLWVGGPLTGDVEDDGDPDG